MYLEVTVGQQRPVIYRLSRPEIILGSLPTNDIIITGPTLYQDQFRIRFKNDHWLVCDPVDPETGIPLEEGEGVKIGLRVKIRFVEMPDTARILELPGGDTDEEFKQAVERAIERKRKKLYDEAHPGVLKPHLPLIKKRAITLLLIMGCAFVLNTTWKSSGNLARDEFIKLPKGAPLWKGAGEQRLPSR